MLNVFNGQLGDTPPLFGATGYGFDDATWHQLCYYPAKCIGKAATEGVFELPTLEQIEADFAEPRPGFNMYAKN